jgi:arginine/lysine/ornithine decarboxylase
VCVVSVHKMGTGFEQGSVFHPQGDLVDPDQLSACADMLMTTSPALALAGRVRAEAGDLPGLRVLHDEFLGAEACHDLDPLHVVIDVTGLGISGYDDADWLRAHQRVDMGLSDRTRIEATLSMADDDQTAARLLAA